VRNARYCIALCANLPWLLLQDARSYPVSLRRYSRVANKFSVLALVAVGCSAQSITLNPSFVDFASVADSATLPGPEELGVGSSQNLPFRLHAILPFQPGGPDFIVLSPSSGTTSEFIWIALNPNVVPYLPQGSYGLTLQLETPGQTSGPYASIPISLVVSPPPSPMISSIVSAASLQPNIAPGGIVSIFGANIGTPPVSAQFNDAGLYPTTLGNTSVTFNGTPAALLYVSTSQINP